MVRLRGLFAVILLVILGLRPATAEPYPAYSDLFVNDLAELLPVSDEDAIRQKLSALKAETGIEMTVLTIPTRLDYDETSSIEEFATRLFNGWGIGNAERNDGILILVVPKDREMRIELGAGYNQGYDVLAQDVVDRYFLPSFRDENYAKGIIDGTDQTIEYIARRYAKGLPAEKLPAAGGGLPEWIFGGIFAVLAGAIVFARKIGNFAFSLRKCPQCGQRGLHRHSEVIQAPTSSSTGIRRDTITCGNCSYSDRHTVTIPARSKGSSGSFGGGRSSGGGATGRW